MKRKAVYGEIFRFGMVGAGATALHYGIYYLLQQVINVNVAYTVGYVLSFVANFYATAYFTFASVPSWKKLFGMGVAHGVNYLLHIVLLNLFFICRCSESVGTAAGIRHCYPGKFRIG